MARFVVRYRGAGDRPREALQRVQSIEGAQVLDDTGRMMLVEAPEHELRSALGTDADWVLSPEVNYPLPDTRKRPASPPSHGS
jgi:hypothetical protein